MDLVERVADWYIRLFRGIFAMSFFFGVIATIFAIPSEQYWLLLVLPALILVSGNMAIFILMYEHLKSIDSKRL